MTSLDLKKKKQINKTESSSIVFAKLVTIGFQWVRACFIVDLSRMLENILFWLIVVYSAH